MAKAKADKMGSPNAVQRQVTAVSKDRAARQLGVPLNELKRGGHPVANGANGAAARAKLNRKKGKKA